MENFEDFDNFERKEEQSLHEYVSMCDFKYRKIEKKYMKLPIEILAFRLLRKVNITREVNMLILTRMNFENKFTLYEEEKKALKKFQGNDSEINSSSSNVKLEPASLAENEEVLLAAGYIRMGGRSQHGSGAKGVCHGNVGGPETHIKELVCGGGRGIG